MNKILLAYALLMTVCAGLVVGGVYVLAGGGWALLAAGGFAASFAEILRRGMTGGR